MQFFLEILVQTSLIVSQFWTIEKITPKSALLSLTILYSWYNCAVQSVEFCQTSTLMDGLLLRNTEVRGAAIGNTKKTAVLPRFYENKSKTLLFRNILIQKFHSFLKQCFSQSPVCENKVLSQNPYKLSQADISWSTLFS